MWGSGERDKGPGTPLIKTRPASTGTSFGPGSFSGRVKGPGGPSLLCDRGVWPLSQFPHL